MGLTVVSPMLVYVIMTGLISQEQMTGLRTTT